MGRKYEELVVLSRAHARSWKQYRRVVKYIHSAVPVCPCTGRLRVADHHRPQANATLLKSLITRQIAAREAGATARRTTNAALRPYARSEYNRVCKHGRAQNASNLAITYQPHRHRENARFVKNKFLTLNPLSSPPPSLTVPDHQTSRAAEGHGRGRAQTKTAVPPTTFPPPALLVFANAHRGSAAVLCHMPVSEAVCKNAFDRSISIDLI